MANIVRLSKFVSVMLRHRAEAFDLRLDDEGFTDVQTVWARVQERYPGTYQYADLLKITQPDQHGKQRFEIDGDRIRAQYGHSAVSEITYPPATPPDHLYHGTTQQTLPAIRKQRLTSQKRQYVHLSTDAAWAQTVGGRRTNQPVVLRVRALEAHHAGLIFHHPEPNHFLVKAIPSQFIDFPD